MVGDGQNMFLVASRLREDEMENPIPALALTRAKKYWFFNLPALIESRKQQSVTGIDRAGRTRRLLQKVPRITGDRGSAVDHKYLPNISVNGSLRCKTFSPHFNVGDSKFQLLSYAIIFNNPATPGKEEDNSKLTRGKQRFKKERFDTTFIKTLTTGLHIVKRPLTVKC
jgi:hypothetical protein